MHWNLQYKHIPKKVSKNNFFVNMQHDSPSLFSKNKGSIYSNLWKRVFIKWEKYLWEMGKVFIIITRSCEIHIKLNIF